VVLLAGHLGAGKTTLVNHLLRHADERRIGVVVNDFGATPVDAVLVAGRADAVASLADGCLCCEVDAGGLVALLATLTAPRAGLDLVLVEASGLAEPRELVRMLLDAARDEAAHAVYGGLVVVVDAVEFPVSRRAHPELVEHVRLADLVVVTKIDRVADTSALVDELRALAPGAVVPVAHGALDPALLAEPAPARPYATQLSFDALLAPSGDHAHAAYESLEHTDDAPLDPARFVALLEAGLPGVFRLKGFARFVGDARAWEVQAVGTALRMRPAPRAARVDGASLVLIGAGLDRPALTAALLGCRAEGPVGEYAMLPVLRYAD